MNDRQLERFGATSGISFVLLVLRKGLNKKEEIPWLTQGMS